MVDGPVLSRESSRSPSTRFGPSEPISISRIERRTKIRIQTWASSSQLTAALADITGTYWPTAVGEVAQGRARVLCTGPTDWLIISDSIEAATLTRELRVTLAGGTFGVVDMSQGCAGIAIGGANARALLSKACALDMHPRAFGPGQCARTRFAQIAAVLDCVGKGSSFDCYFPRSYIDYLASWFTDAAAEFR